MLWVSLQEACIWGLQLHDQYELFLFNIYYQYI